MTLAAASKLRPYEFVGPLGVDGMADMYRAGYATRHSPAVCQRKSR